MFFCLSFFRCWWHLGALASGWGSLIIAVSMETAWQTQAWEKTLGCHRDCSVELIGGGEKGQSLTQVVMVVVRWEQIDLAFQLRPKKMCLRHHGVRMCVHTDTARESRIKPWGLLFFLTYSSYIEAYEVRKIKQSAKTRRRYHHSWVPDEKKQRSQLLWVLCQQQRPVTNVTQTKKANHCCGCSPLKKTHWTKKKIGH